MHTTVEMVHRDDVENVIRLIYESVLKIKDGETFSYFEKQIKTYRLKILRYVGFFIFRPMADEYIDILDKDGNFTGKVALKSEAHQNGWYHASVHIWLYTEDGNILFQKRGDDKDTYPGLWDISVAGHIAAGESSISTAIREAKEEIGIDINNSDLELLQVRLSEKIPTPFIIDNEYNHVFLCTLTNPLDELILQQEEVADARLVSIQTFQSQLESGNLKAYVPHDIDYYKLIVDEIKLRLS